MKSFEEFSRDLKKIQESNKDKRTAEPDEEVWKKWRSLINMTPKELKDFNESENGSDAGLTATQAKEEGIDYGRESARMILKMLPTGGSFESASKNWTPSMWYWARKQNSFNSRMRGARKRIKGNPFERDGKMTRWLKSLLIWGHDPRKPLRKV